MNRRYLSIHSTYRDRNQWPLPADFDVLLSENGVKSRSEALDPVSDAAPIKTFNGSFTKNALSPEVKVNVLTTGVGVSSEPAHFFITAAAGSLRRPNDFYIGATIELENSGVISRRTVKSYEFDEEGDQAEITVFNPFPDIMMTPGTTGAIKNGTEALTTSLTPKVFIPTGVNFGNAYVDYYLFNYSMSPIEKHKIVAYNGETHLATLDSSPATDWSPTDDYVLRKECPLLSEPIQAAPVPTASSITLPLTASSKDDFYKGQFVRIASDFPIPPLGVTTPPFGETRRIVAYDGATRVVTVAPSFSAAPVSDQLVEILCIRDNVFPLNYTGSMVSHQEMVCYEIQLVSLTLPNTELKKGERTAFWPYVWIELSNVSSPTACVKNTIYSNSPHSSRMLFKATIHDISNPLLTPFIKLHGDGMIQTVKFKPNDNLHFSVRLPNGEIFETILQDTVSPVPPNELVQISALFSLRRV